MRLAILFFSFPWHRLIIASPTFLNLDLPSLSLQSSSPLPLWCLTPLSEIISVLCCVYKGVAKGNSDPVLCTNYMCSVYNILSRFQRENLKSPLPHSAFCEIHISHINFEHNKSFVILIHLKSPSIMSQS